LETDGFVAAAAAAAAAGRPLDVFINMNINDISSISEMRMVSKLYLSAFTLQSSAHFAIVIVIV